MQITVKEIQFNDEWHLPMIVFYSTAPSVAKSGNLRFSHISQLLLCDYKTTNEDKTDLPDILVQYIYFYYD